jgi:Subtilase family
MPPLQHQFEYLPLILRERGLARFPRAIQDEDPTTVINRSNRSSHAGGLQSRTTSISANWKTRQTKRIDDGLPSIEAGIPLLLKIDPSLELNDLRRQFNFEIVSEQEDGFVIVASEDIDLEDFQQKLTDFVASVTGSANVARIHELREDLTQEERLKLILTDTLLLEWPNIGDDAEYICDISITCVGNWEVPNKPGRNPRWKPETWARKENEWSTKRLKAYEQWDALKDERLAALSAIIDYYQGEILLNIDNADVDALTLPDSFTLRLKISGKGLRDLILSYPYIFEAAEPDDIETPQQIARDLQAMQARLNIQPPDANASVVCVIDSGIQEEHLCLEPGIDKASSHCFLPGVSATDVADYVRPSGHGTRIAGAVLHGEEVHKSGTLKLETWVQNARVLDNNCDMPQHMFPPAVLREVVKRYHESKRKTRIFNHSINADAPCRQRHMSAWAAELDLLCNDYDVLIIQSAGNLKNSRPAPRLGIAEHIAAGKDYPSYLAEGACRVANPAQSLQAVTVGSIAYGPFEQDQWRSFASEDGHPSAFSRAGLGIWGSIKPEVVEYAGDCLRNRATPPAVDTPQVGRDCYPELVRSTMHGGPAFDRDEVGTSFAAPKVARIASRLQALLPEESCLLYRGLIVQSAHWPSWAQTLSRDEQANVLRRLGYGIPDIERATTNTPHRTTFITRRDRALGPGDCHVYQVPIPIELRRPADEFDIRIDVTLSYAASPRRTRRNPKGYLATWLDWISNGKGEPFSDFIDRAVKRDAEPPRSPGTLGWTIESRGNWGAIPDIRRNIGTVQKDWAIVKSNALPEDLCIAVRGHQGWSHDPDSVARYTLAVTFQIVGQEIPIYEPLRAAVLELESEVEAEMEAEIELETEE